MTSLLHTFSVANLLHLKINTLADGMLYFLQSTLLLHQQDVIVSQEFSNTSPVRQLSFQVYQNTFTLKGNGGDVLYLGLALACRFTCVVLFDRRRFLMARELPIPPSTCQQQEGTTHQLKSHYSDIMCFNCCRHSNMCIRIFGLAEFQTLMLHYTYTHFCFQQHGKSTSLFTVQRCQAR